MTTGGHGIRGWSLQKDQRRWSLQRDREEVVFKKARGHDHMGWSCQKRVVFVKRPEERAEEVQRSREKRGKPGPYDLDRVVQGDGDVRATRTLAYIRAAQTQSGAPQRKGTFKGPNTSSQSDHPSEI